MNYNIELFRGPEQEFVGTVPFMPIVQQSLEWLLGRDLSQTYIQVRVVGVPEDMVVTGSPVIENVIPEYGYAYVRVFVGEHLMYQHPHPLSDIVARTLQIVLRETYPEEILWGYRLDIPGMPERSAMRLPPQVQGGITVQPFGSGEGPPFAIRRVADQEPPAKTLGDFGVTSNGQAKDAKDAMVKVLLPSSIADDLCELRPLSNEMEEGGFLIGRVYRDGAQEGAYLLEVTDAPEAGYTGASLLHFTFTGDSFADVKQTLRKGQGNERLLGWYHTHLFPATPEFGLSSVDVQLHFSTFTIPWQLAGLINLDDQDRTLRFYVRQGNEMALCPYWVIDERD